MSHETVGGAQRGMETPSYPDPLTRQVLFSGMSLGAGDTGLFHRGKRDPGLQPGLGIFRHLECDDAQILNPVLWLATDLELHGRKSSMEVP